MKTLTVKRNQVLFGALVVTLGLSKSWLQTADRALADFSSMAQAEEQARTPADEQSAPPADRAARPRPQQQPAPAAQGQVAQSVTQSVTYNRADGTKVEIIAHISTVDTTTQQNWEIDQHGNIIYPQGTTQKGIKVTFTDTANSESAIGIEALNTNLMGRDLLTQKITEHVSAQMKIKEDKAKAEKELKEAIAKCEKTADGKDLKKKENRTERIECLANSIDSGDLDEKAEKEAFRKFRKELKSEIIKLAQSEDPSDREEARELLENFSDKFDGNHDLDHYIEQLQDGAEDFERMITVAQEGQNSPGGYVDTGKRNMFGQPIVLPYGQVVDAIAGKYNPSRQKGFSTGTQMASADLYDSLRRFAAQIQTNSKSVISRYDGVEDNGSDIGDIDLLDPSLGRAGRRDIGVDVIPMPERLNGRRTDARRGYNDSYRDYADEDDYYRGDRRDGRGDPRYDRYSRDSRNSRDSRYSRDPRDTRNSRYSRYNRGGIPGRLN